MKRVCVVITARPSFSRIRTVLTALRASGLVELQIITAASALVTRFGRVSDLVRGEFEVAAEVPCVVEGDGTRESAMSTGLLTTQLAALFAGLRPDVVVTIADRHETLATAIAASYQSIPLCHIQGGELSGSIDDRVRNAVTQLADMHFVATDAAAARVRRARPGAMVRITGCPSIDIAATALGLGPLPGHDVVVLQHPVTDETEYAGDQISETIEALDGMDVKWFWPGEDAGGDRMAKALRLAHLTPVRNLPPEEFLRVLLGSKCLVGNSSVGIRECSFLGVPAVNIGSRQQGRERGPNVVDVAYHAGAIREAVLEWGEHAAPPRSTLYGDGASGERIARLLVGQAPEDLAC